MELTKKTPEDAPVKRDERFFPGKDAPVVQSDLFIEMFDLPGGPVLIYDRVFHVLFGTSDKTGVKDLFKILDGRGIKELDYVIMPSTNPETVGGIEDILAKFKVTKVGYIVKDGQYQKIEDAAFKGNTMMEMMGAGSIWMLNGTTFDVLYPRDSDLGIGRYQDRSVALMVTKGEQNFLFTGDIDQTAEAKLLKRGKLKKVTALFVTHGAPAGTLNKEFLDAIKADEMFAPNRVKKPQVSAAYLVPPGGSVVLRTDGKTFSVELPKKTK